MTPTEIVDDWHAQQQRKKDREILAWCAAGLLGAGGILLLALKVL